MSYQFAWCSKIPCPRVRRCQYLQAYKTWVTSLQCKFMLLSRTGSSTLRYVWLKLNQVICHCIGQVLSFFLHWNFCIFGWTSIFFHTRTPIFMLFGNCSLRSTFHCRPNHFNEWYWRFPCRCRLILKLSRNSKACKVISIAAVEEARFISLEIFFTTDLRSLLRRSLLQFCFPFIEV